MAGAEGFEPPKAVLETAGLPLAYAPTSRDNSSLLNFFVRLMLAAVRTEFTELDSFRRGLLVLCLGIIAVLALTALKSNNFAHSLYLVSTYYYTITSDTVPAPTVRPPSRIAKRRPLSIATGVISSTTSCTLSPGITISVPSGNCATPVTSVVRK